MGMEVKKEDFKESDLFFLFFGGSSFPSSGAWGTATWAFNSEMSATSIFTRIVKVSIFLACWVKRGFAFAGNWLIGFGFFTTGSGYRVIRDVAYVNMYVGEREACGAFSKACWESWVARRRN